MPLITDLMLFFLVMVIGLTFTFPTSVIGMVIIVCLDNTRNNNWANVWLVWDLLCLKAAIQNVLLID